MARKSDFNPKAPVVVRKRQGLKIGGRRYEQGDAIPDDCVSLRKRQQLFKQNILCYPYDLEDALKGSKDRQAANEEGLEGDGTGDELSEDGVRTNNEANADAEAEASRQAIADAEAAKAAEAEAKAKEEDDAAKAEAEAAAAEAAASDADAESGDDEESGKEGSEEPSKPVASKKKRARKKKS